MIGNPAIVLKQKSKRMKNTIIFLLGIVTIYLSSCEKEQVIDDNNTDSKIYVYCDNTITDATTINDAIASSNSGAEIVICGQCQIDQVIKLLGDRAYRGESLGTILKQADDANLDALMASDTYLDNTDYTGTPVSIRDITLDGNKAMNTQSTTTGIILRSWLSTVEDIQIIDMGGDGLKITNLGSMGAELVTSQVNGKISGNFITESGRYGLFVEDTQNAVTDWILTNNWIADSGMDGIRLDNAAGWIITQNHIYGVPRHALYVHRLFGTSISDNYIEGFGETQQAGSYYGILATIQGDAASTIVSNRIFNFNLEGSEYDPTSNYRYLYLRTNYDTGIISLTGNTIRGAGTENETGLYFTTNPDTWLKVTTAGNAIENVTTEQFIDERVIINP
jgi:hypothetical protein